MYIKYKCSDKSIALAVSSAVMDIPVIRFQIVKISSEWQVRVDSLTDEQHARIVAFCPGVQYEEIV